ncbi:uncharacterized protein LOC116417055 [Nasonia vitripennis]|uniref:Uncharacterized protein n=1 Tax=Nasonia vitripennis TaxID=7425 RepID=A0A7M7QBP5_NASVI|nr:uncharacterized protein LOC116417055 [Nasonia vitripennis]
MGGEECDTEEEIDEDEIVVASEDVIKCIDDDDNDESNSRPNSNKITSTIPPNLGQVIFMNDSIERELNDTYGDSLELLQDENDSYAVIGSASPEKKSILMITRSVLRFYGNKIL